ncbi:MAG: hypothetical protein KGL39_22705 [Patescibacteria group bacterium]|nr:hypothetical protein [Patescibacteria group bacterium]
MPNAVATSLTHEVAGLSSLNTALLPDTCTIQRRTQASDGMGGQTDTWSNKYTGVACRVGLPSRVVTRIGAEVIDAAALTSIADREVVFSAGQDILVEDRIVYSGQTMEVVAVGAPTSFSVSVPVLAKVVQ